MKKTGFVWNYDILQDFLLQKVSQRWIVPVIQGYCRSDRNQTFLTKQVYFTLISRRDTAKAGTRYSQRGIDDQGNVANFVETEL